MIVKIAIFTADVVQTVGLLFGRDDGIALAGAIITIGAFIENRFGAIGRPREGLRL